ncbi:MAG: GYD domain-containing protein [Acidobacteriota bacterium]
MANFVILLRWTQKGIEHVKDSPARFEHFKETVEAVGGKMLSFHMTLGEYDMMAVVDVPDDEAAAKMELSVRAVGTVDIETLRAFDEQEYLDIIDEVP